MRFDWWTFALQAINFLVLVALLWRLLYRPVQRVIAQRREQSDKLLADAAAAQARAHDALHRSEAERAAWPAERERLVTEARADLDRERQHAHDQLRADLESVALAARTKLAEERAAALAELRAHATTLAVELATRLLAQAANPTVSEAALARLVDQLAAVPAAELDRLRAEVAHGAALDVVTAPGLDEAAQARWRARLGERLGPGVLVRFVRDDRLIAGAELHFATTTLRMSWRDVLDEAQKELQRDVVASS